MSLSQGFTSLGPLFLSWNIPLGDPVAGPWLTETVNSLKAGLCLCLLVTAFPVPTRNPEQCRCWINARGSLTLLRPSVCVLGWHVMTPGLVIG